MFQHLQIAPTWRCSLQCPTCDSWKRDQKIELSRAQIDRIAEAKIFEGIKYIVIEGGSPFTWTNLDYFIDKIARDGRIISIITNGFLHDRIEKFLETYKYIKHLLRFVVSLNGIGRQHDITRGKDECYEKTLSTIALLETHEYNFNLQFLPTDTNFGEYRYVKAIGNSLGVNVNVCHPSGTGKYQQRASGDMLAEYEKIKSDHVKDLSWKARFAFECFIDKKKRKELMPCWAGKKMVFIDPNGVIRPCICDEVLALGNISDDNIIMPKANIDYAFSKIPQDCQYRNGQICNDTNIGYTLHRKPCYLLKWKLKNWFRL